MASTYSNLKIQLMTTGENSTTWGSVTNTNLGTAIEEAIAGSADVTFANTNTSITLSNTNLTQAARNMRLNLVGTTGGSTRTLTVPDIEKVYIVNNTCADTVRIANSSGANVAVPAGKTTWVYSTGSNVVDVITSLTALEVDGSNVATLSATQTLTNKTLGADTIATTQSTGDNTTKVATTAFVQAATTALDGFTGTATDLNYAKDLRATGVTTTEFDYLDGVTSSIQTQLNGKISGVTAGTGLTGGGTSGTVTVSHADTSSQSSVNNSGNTVIQDITLDTYGHVTGIGSTTLSIPSQYTDTQARSAQAGTTAFQVGHYGSLRALAGGPFLYNNTYSGQNLAVCDFEGYPYYSGSTVFVIGGSWRCHGYTRSAGALSTGAGASRSTLWIRYA